jgi:hypothetical protein
MSFSVEHHHLTLLISIIKNSPPDLVLISENGSKIRTWKLLVSLFSKIVTELLDNSDHAASIFCPVNEKDIETMLHVLENLDINDDDIICNEAFGILGIDAEQLHTTKNIKSVFMSDTNQTFESEVDKPSLVEEMHPEMNDIQEESSQTEKSKQETNVANTFICNLCDSRHEFGSQYLLQKHLSKKHGLEITCPLCKDAFQQYDQFVEHKDMCKRNIICLICNEKFRTKAALKLHKNDTHIEEQTDEITNLKRVCHICGKEFKKKSTLKHHIKAKHEKEQLPCPYFGESFQEMLTHIKNIHENSVEKCSLCEFQTRRTYSLNLHMRNIHSDVKLKTCEFCGEVRKDLKKHLERTRCGQNINVEKRKDVVCEECPAKFTTIQSLKKHIKYIHLKVKNMECSQCDYKTYSGYNLKIHVTKMHEGKKCIEKETCPVCLKVVTNLPYHNKIYHLGQQLELEHSETVLVF